MHNMIALGVGHLKTDILNEYNPKMSYPAEEWIKADPDFWKPKMAAAVKKTATP